MKTADLVEQSFRPISEQEISMVFGGVKEVQYRDNEGNLITERWSNDGTQFYGLSVDYSDAAEIDWGWAAAGALGGIYVGNEFAGAAATGVALGIEYGVIGAEAGAVLGPVGLVAGAVIGVAAGYVIYEDGPEIWESWGGGSGHEPRTVDEPLR